MTDRSTNRAAWLGARAELLLAEKNHTHARAELAASRRALPRVLLDKSYVFAGPDGEVGLAALFGDCSQLLVYHLMFGPDWDQPCIGCTAWANAINGTTAQFANADARLIAVSRAPYPKLAAQAEVYGWSFPWLSAFGSEFNYDFYASSFDEGERSSRRIGGAPDGELVEFDRGENHGVSVFEMDADGSLYHTYSAYNRGIESLNGAMGYFDLLPKGRAW